MGKKYISLNESDVRNIVASSLMTILREAYEDCNPDGSCSDEEYYDDADEGYYDEEYEE